MALSPKQDRLNRALDEQLTAAELLAFQSLLDDEPDDKAMFERLRRVDDLFRQPQMVAPAPDFAAKVMARIAAEEHLAYAPRRRPRLFIWGLVLPVLLVLPVVLFLSLVAFPALAQPGALTALLAGLVHALGTITGAAGSLLRGLGDLVATAPVGPLMVLTVIPMLMVWAWTVWYFQTQNRPQTVIVPVQFVGSGS